MDNLDRVAYEKAVKTLQRGFDAEAYLVLIASQSRINPSKVDLVPESQVDENIQSLSKEFIDYMAVKKGYRTGKNTETELLAAAENFMSYIGKILTEVTASVDTPAEKQIIENFIANLT